MKFTKILLLINLFFLQSYLLRFQLGNYPTNLQEVLIGITAITFLTESIKNKNLIQKVKNIPSHQPILSLLGLTLFSLILILTNVITISPAINENLHLIRHTKFLLFASMLAFIFMETFSSPKQKSSAIRIAGFGAILFGIFSVIYNLLGYNVAPDSRLLGPLDAAVYLAYYLTPFFLFFSMEFINTPKKKTNLIYAIILALLIIATRSMGAIGGSFLILSYFIYKNNNSKILKSKTTKIVLTLIAIVIVAAIFYTKILPSFQSQYSSLNERGEIWNTSIYILKEPKNAIIGVGFGQFENQYIANADKALGHTPLDYYVIQPHNIFLLFIFHYGIFGLAFLFFCIYAGIKQIKKLQKTDIGYISLFILLYFLVHGLIDTPFFKNDLLILLIIFLEIGLCKSIFERVAREVK